MILKWLLGGFKCDMYDFLLLLSHLGPSRLLGSLRVGSVVSVRELSEKTALCFRTGPGRFAFYCEHGSWSQNGHCSLFGGFLRMPSGEG